MDSIGEEKTFDGGHGEPDLKVGDRIDRYRVIRLLGRGGMGQVYEVEHETLNTRHALKIVHPDLAQQPQFLARFKREAQVMAQLEHPGIVHVEDFSETDGRCWLRMRMLGGVDLAPFGGQGRAVSLSDLAKANGGKIGQALLADILCQVLEALAYAHDKGAIHRDLKPGNILLEERDGEVSAHVSDFGLVRLVGEDWLRSQAQKSVSSGLSIGAENTIDDGAGESTRSLLGTYEYMSPEQKQGSDVDARSDLYSVGLMAARLLTGMVELGRRLPTDFDDALDPGWDKFVDKSTDPRLDSRYQTTAEMLESAQGIRDAIRSGAVAPEPEAAPVLRKKTGKRPVAVIAVILLLAVALGAWYALSNGRDDDLVDAPTPSGPNIHKLPPKRVAPEDAAGMLLEMAKQHQADNKPTEAIAVLDDIIFKYPETPARREADKLKGEIQKAVAAKAALAKRVADALKRAKVQEDAGMLAEAIATLGAVLPDAPGNAKLRDEVARLRKKHKERTTAQERDRAYKTFMDAALAAEIRRDWESAAKAYEAAQTNKPTPEAKAKLATARHNLYAQKANAETDLDKKIGLLVQALAQKDVETTRQLLTEARAEKQRREAVAAAHADFETWMARGATSEKAKRYDEAKGYYARAKTYAEKAGTDETRKAGGAIIRVQEELDRIAREQQRLAAEKEAARLKAEAAARKAREQARLKTEYDAKERQARALQQAKQWKAAVAAWAEAKALGAKLDTRPYSYRRIDDAVAACKKAMGGALPRGWTSETKRVKVATPKGEEWEEIAYYTNTLGMKFVKIPAGEFMMGSHVSADQLARQYSTKAEYFKDEHPLHKVKIGEPFYLGAHEVTNGQYRQFKRDHDSKEYKGTSLNGDSQPVVYVSWNDAKAYCEWLSRKEGLTYRLPTEAEWEYACRAGSRSRYSFGDRDEDLHKNGNYCDRSNTDGFSWQDKTHTDGHNKTAPVGSFPPNAFGLYDMHGNVYEWCNDWHDSSYYGKSPSADPKGPNSGSSRVLRGGSWSSRPRFCRSANRNWITPTNASRYLGFRVVVVLSSPEE